MTKNKNQRKDKSPPDAAPVFEIDDSDTFQFMHLPNFVAFVIKSVGEDYVVLEGPDEKYYQLDMDKDSGRIDLPGSFVATMFNIQLKKISGDGTLRIKAPSEEYILKVDVSGGITFPNAVIF